MIEKKFVKHAQNTHSGLNILYPIIGLKTINIILIAQIGFRNYIKLLRGPINQHKLPRRAQKLQQCPNVLIQSPQN